MKKLLISICIGVILGSPIGIHPPADDIPGRLIGDKIGVSSFEHARSYFSGTVME